MWFVDFLFIYFFSFFVEENIFKEYDFVTEDCDYKTEERISHDCCVSTMQIYSLYLIMDMYCSCQDQKLEWNEVVFVIER